MFGYPMRIELDGTGVTLRPPKKSEMANFSELWSSMVVQRYTNGTHAYTPQDEEAWYDKVSKEQDSIAWAIVPDGADVSIGHTGLHGIHPIWGCCTSGIVIANRDYWRKGVAYRAHLARTWYAAYTLNRVTIQSTVRAPNEASLKALLKVGYRVSGKWDRNAYGAGIYLDTYVLSWVNHHMANRLYPEGIPEELTESLKKATDALALAQEAVKFL